MASSLKFKIITSLFAFITLFVISTKVSNATFVTSEPPLDKINENTPTVTLNYSDLEPGHEYFIIETQSNNKFTADAQGKLSITFCASSATQIKYNCDSNAFFHHNTYTLRLAETGKTVDTTKFTVAHWIPDITFEPQNPNPLDPIKIKICNGRRPFTEERNTYDFDLVGSHSMADPPDIKIGNGQPCTETSFGPFPEGDYKLNVRYNETDSYPLYQFLFTVNSNGGSVQVFKDPKKSGSGAPGQNPCTVGPAGECKTGLGNIPTNAGAFASKILSIAIGLAGGIALILMVIGSIRVLASSGDQQKLAGGRDMLVAAIAGLLFLIFSTIILRFIGISILGL